MRSLLAALTCVVTVFSGAIADSNLTRPLSSRQILPHDFKPPQVWEIEKLERTLNLEKIYAKEEWTLKVKNIAKEPQSEFYIPFEATTIARIGAFEAYEKGTKVGNYAKLYGSEVVAYDTDSSTQFYKITLEPALPAGYTKSITVKFALLSALKPRPAQIEQTDSQHVQHGLSAYAPSAYPVTEQDTTIAFPTTKISEYTILTDGPEPTKSQRRLTYGPYKSIPAGAVEPITVRYELTHPLTHARLLERDIEVSHWGGNVAFEDRYWLENHGAALKNHFSRVQWQMQTYANPPTTALKDLTIPLKPLSADAYFTDDIGNVSTSKFRSSSKSAELWLKPRYPLFGQWKYSFRIGYNNDADGFLRKVSKGEGYILKVPFLEGPKISEGIEYERVELRVILPEGAQNIKFATPVPLVANDTTLHHTFMDTQGRPTLHLTASNLVDEWRDTELIITYDYAFGAAYRKPLTITAAVFAVFATVWLIGSLDVSIGKKGLVKEAQPSKQK